MKKQYTQLTINTYIGLKDLRTKIDSLEQDYIKEPSNMLDEQIKYMVRLYFDQKKKLNALMKYIKREYNINIYLDEFQNLHIIVGA